MKEAKCDFDNKNVPNRKLRLILSAGGTYEKIDVSTNEVVGGVPSETIQLQVLVQKNTEPPGYSDVISLTNDKELRVVRSATVDVSFEPKSAR